MIEGASSAASLSSTTLPLRILPSRWPSIARVLGLSICGIVWGIAFSRAAALVLGRLLPSGSGDTATELSSGSVWFLLLYAFVTAIALIMLLRELIYLWPGSPYYIDISTDGIALKSPFRLRRFTWQEFSPFELRVRPGRGMAKLSIVAKSRSSSIRIASDDFSTRLVGSRKERAQALTTFLNEVSRCEGHAAIITVPKGLVVASIARLDGASAAKALVRA